MDSSVALVLSIVVILALITLRLNIGVSIFIGALILGLLTIGFESLIRIIYIALSLSTMRIVAIVLLALALGYSMEHFKLLERLVSSAKNTFDSFSIAILPALLGFLPMPGGALISAVMIRDLVEEFNIKPETATYINYWFRHLWVPIWPLFPSFIIALAVVEVDYIEIIKATYPITITSVIAGLYFTRKLKIRFKWNLNDFKVMTFSLYPILLISFLALFVKLDLLLTLVISLIILYVHKRPNLKDLGEIFRNVIDLRFVMLVVAVMSFKSLIEETNAALEFFNHLNSLNFSVFIASCLLSFIVGFATGIEMSYSAIALPLLTSFTGVSSNFNPLNFMLVIAFGFFGVMLSPLHLCLVLTAEYYKANLKKTYYYLLTSVLMCITIVLILYFIN